MAHAGRVLRRHRGEDSFFGVRRLVAALPFQDGIFVNRRGKTANIPIQFQVKPAEQTNVVPKAKLLEKESGDESPHSKGRLFQDECLVLPAPPVIDLHKPAADALPLTKPAVIGQTPGLLNAHVAPAPNRYPETAETLPSATATGTDHALTETKLHLTRLQIGDADHQASDQIFRLVSRFDSGKHVASFTATE